MSVSQVTPGRETLPVMAVAAQITVKSIDVVPFLYNRKSPSFLLRAEEVGVARLKGEFSVNLRLSRRPFGFCLC